MERMNLFTNKGESSEASFGDIKPRERKHSEDFKNLAIKLAEKIGVEAAADELNISVNTLLTWNHTLAKSLSSSPIKDEDVCFTLEGKTYSLNVNSKEERERVKQEVNANSLAKYDWFKEEMGEKHWVLYNTAMYKIEHTAIYWKFYLHYKEDSNLIPIIPINATSCYSMFKDCSRLTTLDIRNFDTSGVIDMHYMFKNCSKLTLLDFTGFNTSNATDMSEMFCNCEALTKLDLSSFNTSKVTNMSFMFSGCELLTQLDLSNFDTSQVIKMSCMFDGCESLTQLDLSNFDTSKVTDIDGMFTYCTDLTNIFISNKWNTNRVDSSRDMFAKCRSLSNFNRGKTGIEMAKPVEQGGYLTLKR